MCCRFSRMWSAVALSCMVVTGIGGCPPPPPAPDPDPNEPATTYGGRALLLRATIAGNETIEIDTGELPAVGGALENSALSIEIPDVLIAEIGHVTTLGGRGVAHAQAALANIFLTVGDQEIAADFLMTLATARCRDGVPHVTGELLVSNLTINGVTTAVTAAPNQEITLNDTAGQPIGRVVLNEQIAAADSELGDVTVNAVHLEIFNFADVVLFHAHADIRCGFDAPFGDFMNGGGFIVAPGGGRAHFALAGGALDQGFFGHVVYQDEDTGLRLRSTNITAFAEVDSRTRRIEGPCEIDGQGGFTFVVVASDQGERGVGDTFSIELSNGYEARGTLIGGDILLE